MSSICCLYTGNSINKETKLKKYIGHSSGTPYIGTKDIKFDGSIIYDNEVRIPSSDLSSFSIAPKNSILLCIEGGSAGRKIAIANQEVCFGNKLCCFVPSEINSHYLFYYLQSASFKESFLDKKSGLIGGVSINKLREIKIAYPSLSLQQKIVSIIDKAFCVIDCILFELNRN